MQVSCRSVEQTPKSNALFNTQLNDSNTDGDKIKAKSAAVDLTSQ